MLDFPNWEQNAALGRLVDALITENMSWINRRVETISILQDHGETRSVSVDVDLAELKRIAESAAVEFGIKGNGGFVPVPLGWMAKGLILDFSVRDAENRPLSVWRSPDDSRASWASLMAILKYSEHPVELCEELKYRLYQSCLSHPGQVELMVLQYEEKPLSELPLLWKQDELSSAKSGPRKEAWGQWLQMTDDPGAAEFMERLRQLRISYLPIVDLPIDVIDDSVVPHSTVIKFELVTTQQPASKMFRVRDRWGIARSFYQVRIDGNMEASREHVHFIPPPGVGIVSVPIPMLESDGSSSAEPVMLVRASYKEAAIYRSSKDQRVESGATAPGRFWAGPFLPKRSSLVTLRLKPILSGIDVPTVMSLIGSLVAMILLLVSYVVEEYGWNGEKYNLEKSLWPMDSLVPVLLMGFSVVSAGVATGQVVSARDYLLGPIRKVAGATMAFAVLVTLTTGVFSESLSPIALFALWAVGLGWTAIVLFVLLMAVRACRKERDDMDLISPQTFKITGFQPKIENSSE
jgi:hypothetical protein